MQRQSLPGAQRIGLRVESRRVEEDPVGNNATTRVPDGGAITAPRRATRRTPATGAGVAGTTCSIDIDSTRWGCHTSGEYCRVLVQENLKPREIKDLGCAKSDFGWEPNAYTQLM
jgi:hypothetical protein